MSNEFLCRGKRVYTHRWVDGYYVKLLVNAVEEAYLHLIIGKNDGQYNSVDFETVGRYTELTDKNGVKIFEGDIVKRNEAIYEVKYSTEQVRFLAILSNGIFNPAVFQNCEVIGNIHDSPELLGGITND